MKKFVIIIASILGVNIALNAQTPLPNDPATRVGKLDNGLTYYLRHNDKPAQRAEFYLATHIGAIQETPDQDGLAHFLEHMCFNGLKNLPGKQMLDYLQSIGAEFGRNINASTGVESTQYMLNNIPVAREGVVDTCLLIMHDYSHFVLNEQEEIDAERGVIIEERRQRRNASWRMYEQNKRYMYKGSKYADCSLIGSQENLETFKRESLVNFYETWYRPDNQALVVVGDIDVDKVEAKIKSLWADIPAPVNPKQKDVIKIPDNKEPIVGVVTDPEATGCEVELLWKSEPIPAQFANTDVAFINDLLKDIISNVMSERFEEITSKPGAPFLGGFLGIYKLTETCEAVLGDVSFKEGEALPAFKAFYTEIEKMKRFGFSDSEIQRAKDEILSRYEKRAEGADSRKNPEFVQPIISNFFNNTPYMDPAVELQLAKAMLAAIPAAAVNQTVAQIITDDNMVLLYNGPAKEGLVNPTEEQLLETLEAVKASDIQANAEEVIDSQFIDPASIRSGKVKKTRELIKGFKEWTLSNGVTVAYLPTEFKKDQVLVRLVMDGGQSLIPDADLPSFESNIWNLFRSNSGVSKYPSSTVTKMLAGKQVSVNTYINAITHGISASCQPKDLETALQLLYLNFTDPRYEQDAFDVAKSQIEAVLPNLQQTPDFKFQQAFSRTLFGDNPRNIVLDQKVLDAANLATIEKNCKKLFASAKGAKVYIVGNVDPETLKPLVEKYIASLPAKGKALSWKDTGERLVQGKVENAFKADMQTPQTTVLQVYNNYDTDYSVAKKVNLSAASFILDMIYVATLREEEGGTYGASSAMEIQKYPVPRSVIQVYFNTNPSSSDKLRSLAVEGLRKLAEEGPTEEQMTRVRENFAKNIPESRIQNGYWLEEINYWYNYKGMDYDAEYEAAVAALTPESIKNAVSEVLASGNFVEVVMSPDKTAERE